MWHSPLCSSKQLWNAQCLPGHFVQALVIWISSGAVKAVILMLPPPPPPPPHTHTNSPGINSKEELVHWCSGCFSDTVSWERSGLCVCRKHSLTTRDLCLTWLNHIWPANQRGHKGTKTRVCVCVCLYEQRRGNVEMCTPMPTEAGRIVFVSWTPREHTPLE